MLTSEKSAHNHKHNNPIFENSENLYSSGSEVKRKWLKEYGRISADNSASENNSILRECFNMLDAVAGYKLKEFLLGSDSIQKRGEDTELLSKYKNGENDCFFDSNVLFIVKHSGKSYTLKDILPKASFFNKINNLIAIGFDIPAGINKKLRPNRNNGAHTTATTYEENIKYSEEELKAELDLIAQALINMGLLEEELRCPSFEDMRVQLGSTLKNRAFRIDSYESEGSSCRVFRGTQLSLNRSVAVKEYIPEAFGDKKIALSLVKRECSALVKLNHPNIPSVFDTFSENGTYYVVMEFINGVSLNHIKGLDFQKTVDILIEICNAISYLHSLSINHCDLKPDNIMVGTDGHVHLIDFGISNVNTNEPSVSAGSYGFSDPEIISGRPSTPCSDLYSIGKIMFFLMQDVSRCSTDQKQNSDFIRIAEKASMNVPEERYSSADVLRSDIEAMMKSQPLSIDMAQSSPSHTMDDGIDESTAPAKKARNQAEEQALPEKYQSKHRRMMITALSILLALVVGVTSVILLTKHDDNVMTRLYETENHIELYKTTEQGVYVQEGQLYFTLAIKNRSDVNIKNILFRIEIRGKIGDSVVYDVEVPFDEEILPGKEKSFTIRYDLSQYITDLSFVQALNINIIKVNGEDV